MSLSTPERILQRLDWQVIRRLDGLLQGDYRSLFYGQGLDLADLREYQPEDDIRYIDWNVTARMDTPYVRQYIEDRDITAWFLIDLSPSVDFGVVETLKRNTAVDFAAVLSRLLTRHGNRVGAIVYSGQVDKIIPARGGRMHVLRLINDLLRQPKLSRAPFTDLCQLLEAGLHVIRRKSLIFVLSDFISSPGWDRPLRLLAQRNEVVAVRLWDEREEEMPDVGLVVLEDAETGEQMYVDTHDARFRKRFKQAAERRRAELDAAFRRAGVDQLALSTGDDLVKAVLRFAELRKQHQRQAASTAA